VSTIVIFAAVFIVSFAIWFVIKGYE